MNAPRSFSLGRRWSLSLSVAVSVLAALALVLMANYLAVRHFKRWPLAAAAQGQLSPLTKRVLGALTNEVRVTLFFDRQDALFSPIHALLKEYKYVNDRITLEIVDYLRDPTAGNLVKAKYRLTLPTEKNLVIFECPGRAHRVVTDGELSDYELGKLLAGESREVRRVAFRGEQVFTSAILGVTSPRALKACFLQGHGEHRPDSDDKLLGYSKFAAVLRENNVPYEPLSLGGAAEVPADCSLLIIAGPTDPLLPEELAKIDQYLKQGGRLFALFNYYSAARDVGLERLLAGWGLIVGHDVVQDRNPQNTLTGQDVILTPGGFGGHPIVRPLYQSRLYVVLPRSVSKARMESPPADAPQVTLLASTSAEGRVLTDLRDGAVYPSPNDATGAIPVMAAAEKGSIRGVSADRGSTRMVVCGESIFLGNETIDKLGNREFATHAVNWLLARNELLVSLGPQPVKEYKVTMSVGQLAAVRWILMLGMPGSVVLLGLLVAVRRRK
jgi:hypothetical protein